MKIRTLIIDHNDSFTHNIKAWLESGNFETKVINYHNSFSVLSEYDLIVLSPGPGHPSEYIKSKDLIKNNLGIKPIFGVCLGMQLLAENSGATIHTTTPHHGKTSSINIDQSSTFFTNISTPLRVARYHSLISTNDIIYDITANIEDVPMAIECIKTKVLGVQFHPESFLTEQRDLLLKNLENWVTQCN